MHQTSTLNPRSTSQAACPPWIPQFSNALYLRWIRIWSAGIPISTRLLTICWYKLRLVSRLRPAKQSILIKVKYSGWAKWLIYWKRCASYTTRRILRSYSGSWKAVFTQWNTLLSNCSSTAWGYYCRTSIWIVGIGVSFLLFYRRFYLYQLMHIKRVFSR